jgi:hypothetical protein
VATHTGVMFIDPPPPPPRPYGLFDVALGPMPFPSPASVGGGVQYIPDTCQDNVYLYDMTCPAVSGSKTFDVLETAISGGPFAVITSFICGSVGITAEEVRNRLLIRMQLHEQKAVERRLWQGQTLAQGQGAITGLFRSATSLGTAGCATEAIELLEQVLADNSIVGGMIHARPGMASHLEQAHQIQYANNGRRLQTCLGTPFVFGQGYDGTGPANQAPTTSTEWMYATGRVVIWQDTEIAVPALDQVFRRDTNERIALAERVYAVAVECGIWAVEVTRTCTTTGVPA